MDTRQAMTARYAHIQIVPVRESDDEPPPPLWLWLLTLLGLLLLVYAWAQPVLRGGM